MRFSALAICLFLVTFNVSLMVISSLAEDLGLTDEDGNSIITFTPQFMSDADAESGIADAGGPVSELVSRVLNIGGFVDDNGNLNGGQVALVVAAVASTLAAITTLLRSSIGTIIGIYSIVFWSSFMVSYVPIMNMIGLLGRNISLIMEPALILIVGLLFILSMLELGSGVVVE